MQWILCTPSLYRYDGWFFEWQSYGGPWPLRNNGELRKRAGREFWRMIGRFQKLTPAERKQYRVGGGCTVLTTASTVTAAPVGSKEIERESEKQ